MNNTLYKTISRTFIPGSPGRPGHPGQPFRAARWENQTRDVCSYTPDPNIMASYGFTYQWVPGYSVLGVWFDGQWTWVPPDGFTGSVIVPHVYLCRTEVYQVYVPGQPYIAPTPAIPSTPAQTILDFNIGWTGRARSIRAFANAGETEFKVHRSVTGAVVGLNTAFNATGYADIRYAFYLSHGIARVMESGSVVANLGAYAEGAVFKLRRYAGKVTYFVDDVEVWESDNSPEPMHLDAALYIGDDTVFDPAIEGLSYSDTAFEPLHSIGSEDAYAFSATEFQPLQTASRAAVGGQGVFHVLTGLGSDRIYGSGTAELPYLTSSAEGGFVLPSYAIADTSFYALTGVGAGLTGEIGGATSVFNPLGGLGSGGTAIATSSSTTVTNPDSSITTTEIVVAADGSTTTTTTTTTNNLDGSTTVVVVVNNPDGTTTTTTTVTTPSVEGGSTSTIVYETVNAESEVIASGSGVGETTAPVVNEDGSTSTTTTTVVNNSDGTTTTTVTETTVHPDGSTSTTTTVTVTDGDGNVVDTTTTVSDTTAPVTQLDGSTTTTTTTTVTANDGSTTTTVTGTTTETDGSTSSVITSQVSYGEATVVLHPLTASGYLLGETEMEDVGLFSAAFSSQTISPFTELVVVMTSSGEVGTVFAYSVAKPAEFLSTLTLTTPYSSLDELSASIITTLAVTVLGRGVGEETQVWVLNTETEGSTRYENYAFNSFAKIGDSYFGCKADGIYKLEGADDAGDPIRAMLSFGKWDFGTSYLKQVPHCYVGVSSNDRVFMKVIVEGEEYLYVANSNSEQMQAHRVDLGRGLEATYFEFELYNADGDDFELASVEFVVVPTTRRV